MKKENYQDLFQKQALRKSNKRHKSPLENVARNSQTPRCTNTPLTQRTRDRANFFDILQRFSLLLWIRVRKIFLLLYQYTCLPLNNTSRQEANHFETVWDHSTPKTPKGTSFTQHPHPRRGVNMEIPFSIRDLSLLTPSPRTKVLLGITTLPHNYYDYSIITLKT